MGGGFGAGWFFRPFGAMYIALVETQGLRPGLLAFAASRLPSPRPSPEYRRGRKSGVGGDSFAAGHVGAEDFGDGDGAVFVLVLLEDGDEDSGAGDGGVVEGVAELGLGLSAFGLFAVAEVKAAGLEVFE